MKVLLKSLEELKEEYDIEKVESSYLIATSCVSLDINNLLGKIVEAEYDKGFIINGYYFDPSLIKGIVIREEYTIKRLSDSFEYTLSF